MRVAAFQGTATVLDVEANLAAIAEAAADAASQGVALLVTPELFVTGYAPAEIAAGFDASTLPSIHDELARIAREASIGLVASLPEPHDGGLGIVALRLDGAGVVRDRHVKTQLFGPDERAAFAPGDELAPHVDDVALAICYEVEFPEYVRAAARSGARLLAVPTAITPRDHRIPDVLVPARALENGIRIVYANHCGVEAGLTLAGRSVIADQHGAILAQAGEEPELLVADLDDSAPIATYLDDRRDDLYDGPSRG